MDAARLRDFANRYTAAWCSQHAASVAAHFAADGTLTMNGGTPSVGRAAIAAAAQGFMTDFPDLEVAMDGIAIDDVRAVYRWRLTGTHAGTGASVRISGRENGHWTRTA